MYVPQPWGDNVCVMSVANVSGSKTLVEFLVCRLLGSSDRCSDVNSCRSIMDQVSAVLVSPVFLLGSPSLPSFSGCVRVLSRYSASVVPFLTLKRREHYYARASNPVGMMGNSKWKVIVSSSWFSRQYFGSRSQSYQCSTHVYCSCSRLTK